MSFGLWWGLTRPPGTAFLLWGGGLSGGVGGGRGVGGVVRVGRSWASVIAPPVSSRPPRLGAIVWRGGGAPAESVPSMIGDADRPDVLTRRGATLCPSKSF